MLIFLLIFFFFFLFPISISNFFLKLFFDPPPNNTVYLSTTLRKSPRSTPAGLNLKDFAIHLSRLDLATGRALSPPRLIRESLVGAGVAEGSHLFRRGRWYYLFTAEGGTEGGHNEVVCRSDVGPEGPWEVGPTVLGAGALSWAGAGEKEGEVVGEEEEVGSCGHADLVEDEGGRWWAVFLGVRKGKGGGGGGMSVFGEFFFFSCLFCLWWGGACVVDGMGCG